MHERFNDVQITHINFAPTSFSTRSTPNLHIVTTSGSPIFFERWNQLLLRLRALCWFCLQNLATRALPKFNSCFTLVTYLTDFCVQESSTRGRATTSAPCAYRVVYERLLSPSAPPQIFFCERLPWKLISHSATSQDVRNPIKDPIKDSWTILDWWNIL